MSPHKQHPIDKQIAAVALICESLVTLSKRDFAALTKALNGPFKPNRALKGALAEAAAKVRRAWRTAAAARSMAAAGGGAPGDMRNTHIAGIALARNATLATRNVRHFGDMKVPVVDPWVAQGA